MQVPRPRQHEQVVGIRVQSRVRAPTPHRLEETVTEEIKICLCGYEMGGV